MKILKALALSGALLSPSVAAADWSGFYMGGTLGFANLEFDGGSDTSESESHNPIGAFLGYQLQSGDYTYGFEYSIAATELQFEDFAGDVAVAYGDLKARFGFDAGQYMPYGLISYSAVALADSFDDASAEGFGFGAGIDYAVSDNFIIGGEFISRGSDGATFNGVDTNLIDINSSSLSLRASYKF